LLRGRGCHGPLQLRTVDIVIRTIKPNVGIVRRTGVLHDLSQLLRRPNVRENVQLAPAICAMGLRGHDTDRMNEGTKCGMGAKCDMIATVSWRTRFFSSDNRTDLRRYKGSPHAQVTIRELGRNVAQFVAFKFASRVKWVSRKPTDSIDSNLGGADGSSYLLWKGRSDAGDVSVGRARIVNSASGYQ
jgi:hypothetical protein